MAEVLAIPFDKLKIEINETRIELAASLNTSILPPPPLSSLSAQNANDMTNQLCSDLDTSIIDDTAKALHHMSTVAIGLMFLALFVCWAALCIWEWRRYRAMRIAAEEIEREWEREKTMDVYRMVAIVENPVLERYGSAVLQRVAPKARTRMNLRWYSKSSNLISGQVLIKSGILGSSYLSCSPLCRSTRVFDAAIPDHRPRCHQRSRSSECQLDS
jgi:hypothetical protein